MKSIIAYASGTPREIAAQTAQLEAYACRERVTFQMYSDAGGPLAARVGLAAAIASAVQIRVELVVQGIDVFGVHAAGHALVLHALGRVGLTTIDGTRPSPSARAALRLLDDADRLRQGIKQVKDGLARPTGRGAGQALVGVRLAADINEEVAALRAARERERLGLPVESETVEPAEGSALRPAKRHDSATPCGRRRRTRGSRVDARHRPRDQLREDRPLPSRRAADLMNDRERNELEQLVGEIVTDLNTIESKLRQPGRRRLVRDVVLARTNCTAHEVLAFLGAGHRRATA